MNVYTGKHPVFVSHTKELEQMAYFTADLQYRQECKGVYSGILYDCLVRVRRKCADLLLKMYAEDSNIILLDDTDNWWIRRIVWYVHNVILKDQRKVG